MAAPHGASTMARALPKCHSASLIIANTVPLVPFTVAVGQSKYPEQTQIRDLLETKVARLIWFDAVELARRHYRRARELGSEPDALIEQAIK